MDAVSFVLGEKTANLRVRSLKVSQSGLSWSEMMETLLGADLWSISW